MPNTTCNHRNPKLRPNRVRSSIGADPLACGTLMTDVNVASAAPWIANDRSGGRHRLGLGDDVGLDRIERGDAVGRHMIGPSLAVPIADLVPAVRIRRPPGTDH